MPKNLFINFSFCVDFDQINPNKTKQPYKVTIHYGTRTHAPTRAKVHMQAMQNDTDACNTFWNHRFQLFIIPNSSNLEASDGQPGTTYVLNCQSVHVHRNPIECSSSKYISGSFISTYILVLKAQWSQMSHIPLLKFKLIVYIAHYNQGGGTCY